MTTSIAVRRACLSVLGVIIGLAAVVVVAGVSIVPSEQGLELGFFVALLMGLGAYWALGAVIVLRADGHVVGWLFAIAAAMLASTFACYALGFVLGLGQPPNLAGGWFSLLGALLFTPAAILVLPAVMILFPTGTLPGRRWRWPVRLIVGLVVAQTLAILLTPGPMVGDGGPVNPLTPWLPVLPAGARDALSAIELMGTMSILFAAVTGVVAIAVRFRRSTGDERQQLKWFLAVMVPAAILLPLSLSDLGNSIPFVDVISIATIPLLALTVAVSIMRYHLYDIDRIISRTISYGLITALLVAVFLLVNLGLQSLLSSVTSGNSLAVAGSTLLAAGLFTPVRRRVQRIVDRRFDRARYDGERTTSAFSVRMRDAIDLPTVAQDLDVTVRRAIAPSRVGLWLRGSGR